MSIRNVIIGKFNQIKEKVENNKPLTEADLEAVRMLAKPRNFQPETPSSPKSSYDEASARIEELKRENAEIEAKLTEQQRAMSDILEKGGVSPNSLAYLKVMDEHAKQYQKDSEVLESQKPETSRGPEYGDLFASMQRKTGIDVTKSEQKKAHATPDVKKENTSLVSPAKSTPSRPITTQPKRSNPNFSYKSGEPKSTPNKDEAVSKRDQPNYYDTNSLAYLKVMDEHAKQYQKDSEVLKSQKPETSRGPEYGDLFASMQRKTGIDVTKSEQKKAHATPDVKKENTSLVSPAKSTPSRPITTQPKRRNPNFSYKSTPNKDEAVSKRDQPNYYDTTSTVPNVSERAFNDVMEDLLRKQGIGVTKPEQTQVDKGKRSTDNNMLQKHGNPQPPISDPEWEEIVQKYGNPQTTVSDHESEEIAQKYGKQQSPISDPEWEEIVQKYGNPQSPSYYPAGYSQSESEQRSPKRRH